MRDAICVHGRAINKRTRPAIKIEQKKLEIPNELTGLPVADCSTHKHNCLYMRASVPWKAIAYESQRFVGRNYRLSNVMVYAIKVNGESNP